MNRHAIKWAMAILVIVLAVLGAACGTTSQSPVAPTTTSNSSTAPQLCYDHSAANYGSSLPCSYTPPVQSTIKVSSTTPADGGVTLSYSKQEVYVYADYTVAQSDLDEATRTGDTIYTVACLSVDGVKPLPLCFYSPAVGARGQNELHTGVSSLSPVPVTNFIISYLKFRHGVGQGSSERTIAENVLPKTFYWIK